jgi:protein-disulfide isomerase
VEPQLAALIESGDVKFTYKHMIVVGDKVRSQWAAEAAECAADQGKFWAFHDELFARQKTMTFSKGTFKSLAGALGMDTEVFGQCVDSGKYESAVKKQSQEGVKLGLQGTPSFLINGKYLPLQRTYDEIAQAVKQELNK